MVDSVSDDIYRLYQEYCFNHNTADEHLRDLIWDYEEQYFEDMRMQPDSVISAFMKMQSQYNGKWVDDYFSVEDCAMNLDANYFRYYVEELGKGVGGRMYAAERKIVIAPKCVKNKIVILHEMIHAYEMIILEWQPSFMRDILFYCLYKNLKEKVSDLDTRIFDHAHAVPQISINSQGGAHDLLFFLKSLDLDLRCGFKVGTVCGYGRDEY